MHAYGKVFMECWNLLTLLRIFSNSIHFITEKNYFSFIPQLYFCFQLGKLLYNNI